MADRTGIEWTDVPGWRAVKVNRLGQLKGPSGRILKPYVVSTGHQHVLISKRKLRVHHAVLLAFVGPRPTGALGRHMDDDPSNNTVENLAWGTYLDNAADRHRNKGFTRGEARPNHRLTKMAVEAIRLDTRSSRLLAAEYGVSHTAIQRVRRGERWAA